MKSSHTKKMQILLNFANDEREIEVEVHYTITPGWPATGPSYASGGEPAEPAEIIITHGHIVSEPDSPVAPTWLLDIIENSEEAYAVLGEHADWGHTQEDPDDARDRRRDDELTDRLAP